VKYKSLKYKSLKRIVARLLSYRPLWLQELELAADEWKMERQDPDFRGNGSPIWELERRRANAAMYLSKRVEAELRRLGVRPYWEKS
jgi:hypothetical protein